MTPPADPLARNAPLRRLAVASLVVAALALSCFNVTNLDLGGHLTVGREILKTRAIPDTEFFSHTSKGHEYPVHQWLGEVILFGVEHTTGENGLILLRMAITLFGAILLYRNARREGAPVAVAVGIVLLLLFASRPRLFVRPYLVSWVFLPLLHSWILDVREGRTRRLWPILPLLAIWGHLHSGVLFGVLMLFAVIVGEGIKGLVARRRRGSVAGLRPLSVPFPGHPIDGWNYRRLLFFSAAAIALPFATMAIVNPSGLKPLILPVLFLKNAGFQQMIAEYRSVDILVDWPFDLVAGALILGVILRPKQVDLTDLFISAGFGILAYQAVRGVLPFAVTAAPLLGRTWGAFADVTFARVAAWRGRKRGRGVLANRAEAVAITLVMVAAGALTVRAVRSSSVPFGFGKDPKHYPERALDFLQAQDVGGPMFNTDLWASSLLWRFHGRRYPVFVDARLEAYPESFWPDIYYRVLQAAPGWDDVLDRFDVQFAFIRREGGETDDRLGEVLWDDPRWGLVYWDDRVVIYLRRDSPSTRNQRVLADWEFDSFNPRRPQAVRDLEGADLERAATQLRLLHEWNPDSFLLGWTLGAARVGQGRGAEAVVLFDGLARDRGAKDNPPFSASRAEAELAAGNPDGWARSARRAGVDPDDPDEMFGAASRSASFGQPGPAISLYREVLVKRPADADAMNNLALLLAETDPAGPEALRLVETALAKSPDDPYYIATKGEVLFGAGRREEALAAFQASLDLLPADDKAARRHVMKWILETE